MATVVVTGGGLIGLSTAMLMAKDGHEVTVLERDPSPPPATPIDAWEQWERKGVNQFRLLHMFLPRFRQIASVELPEVIAGMDAAGALRINSLVDAPVELTGGPRPGDEELEAVTARRPVAESVVASVAQATPGVTIRRGVAIQGVLTGTPAAPGVPHVVGGLPQGKGGQQTPQAVPVGQVREPAVLGVPAERVERAEGHVLLVGRPPRGIAQPGPGQPDQAREIPLPQVLGRFAVAGLGLHEPAGDRSL